MFLKEMLIMVFILTLLFANFRVQSILEQVKTYFSPESKRQFNTHQSFTFYGLVICFTTEAQINHLQIKVSDQPISHLISSDLWSTGRRLNHRTFIFPVIEHI